MNKKIGNATLSFGLFCLLQLAACQTEKNEPEGGGEEIAGNQEVLVKPERDKLLRNPMMGWVLYAGLGDGLSETYWQDYDNLASSKGAVKVSDYATTLYIRGAWSDFNPEEGRYVWDGTLNTKPAKRYRMLVEGAKTRGLKLAITFVVDSRDKAYDFTPAYVKNAPGIEGYETTTGTATRVWSPYPDNPVFQSYYTKFIHDFAKKYDDPDVMQYVSGQGLGLWGEYHTCVYSTRTDGPREAVFRYVVDLYSGAFKKVPVIINYHRWIGTGKQWDGAKFDPDTERLLAYAVSKGFSLRHDAFGMKTYYTTWERDYAAGQRYKRPIIMEGGWVKSSHGNSIKGDGYETYADVRQGEFDEAKGAFVNMMDFRYNKNVGVGETYSWFNDAFYLVEEFIREGGYRLYPDRLSLPPTVKNGSQIKISHRWINLGWGYCPTNIPQWNYKYKVAFALLDKTTFKPQYIFVDPDPDLSQFIKGSPRSYVFAKAISGVKSGNYVWAVGLVDTTKENAIGIQIAAKENVTSEGWVKLMDTAVQ